MVQELDQNPMETRYAVTLERRSRNTVLPDGVASDCPTTKGWHRRIELEVHVADFRPECIHTNASSMTPSTKSEALPSAHPTQEVASRVVFMSVRDPPLVIRSA